MVNASAARTVLVNLALDVLLAVIVVVLPAISGSDTNWSLVIGSAVKTAVATALVSIRNLVERSRASSETSGDPT